MDDRGLRGAGDDQALAAVGRVEQVASAGLNEVLVERAAGVGVAKGRGEGLGLRVAELGQDELGQRHRERGDV
jgi:hypothetical protein